MTPVARVLSKRRVGRLVSSPVDTTPSGKDGFRYRGSQKPEARTVRPSGRPVRAGRVTDVGAAEQTTLTAAGGASAICTCATRSPKSVIAAETSSPLTVRWYRSNNNLRLLTPVTARTRSMIATASAAAGAARTAARTSPATTPPPPPDDRRSRCCSRPVRSSPAPRLSSEQPVCVGAPTLELRSPRPRLPWGALRRRRPAGLHPHHRRGHAHRCAIVWRSPRARQLSRGPTYTTSVDATGRGPGRGCVAGR